jgi:transposase
MMSAELQAEILTLYFTEKCSVRSISIRLGLHRRSVQRVVDRRSVQLQRGLAVRASILDSFKEEVRDHLRKNPRITSTALLNRLRMLGYTGGVTVVKEYVRTQRLELLRPRQAFLRLEFAAGEVAQVDWGEFGDVFGDGIKVHCFAMVLAYSRYIYIEFTRSEKFEEFIRCHESAFKFFGGAPKECWYDNLATAVSDRVGSLVRFNSRFMSYIGHHSIRPHACNVARGNEKGRVEDLIKYIRMNFWPGRTFTDFDDLTKQAIVWRNQTANQREHRSTRRVVRLMFEAEEKPALLMLNPTPYDTDEVFSRHVPPDFHIQYETNRYSVPWTLVGMVVTIRVNHLGVKIYYNEKLITSHSRSYLKNKVFTIEGHRTGLLERKPGATRETWQLNYVKQLGPKMSEYVELVRQGPRSLKNELSRLVALVTVYGPEQVISACQECLRAGIVGVDSVELYLKRTQHPSEQSQLPPPIQFMNERLNRVVPAVDLRRYDALLFEGFESKSASEERVNGPREKSIDRGPSGIASEILESVAQRGSGDHEGPGAGTDQEISGEVDCDGAIRTTNTNDSEQSEIGKIPPTSDGGDF